MAVDLIYDLIVIGAGPAGTAAAITATRSGARVLLLDAGRFPRHKVCGEFVSSESLALLNSLLGSPQRSLLETAPRIADARLFLDGRVLHTAIDPPAASIARFDLDAALLQSAESAGAEIRLQTPVQDISAASPFHVTTTAGDFASQAIINASGRWSKLTAPPAQKIGEKWLGVKGHFFEASPATSVDLYFFDGGYCGVQPVKLVGAASATRVNACAMVRADKANSLAEVFTLNPALQQRSCTWQPLSQPVSTSPLFFRQPQPERGGILFAGDAACFVDPFVGDGISLALRSGTLAAECLSPFFRQIISLHTAASNYTAAYTKNFATVFNTSSGIRKMLLLPRPVRTTFLRILERVPAATRYLLRRTRAA